VIKRSYGCRQPGVKGLHPTGRETGICTSTVQDEDDSWARLDSNQTGFEITIATRGGAPAGAHSPVRPPPTGSPPLGITRALVLQVGEHGPHAAVGFGVYGKPQLEENLLNVSLDRAFGDEQAAGDCAV
jgi:hypothetical protein